jgi:hypothetical protein
MLSAAASGRLYATYKNDPEAARVHLQRALALDPTMAPALELMAALDQSEHYSESDAASACVMNYFLKVIAVNHH